MPPQVALAQRKGRPRCWGALVGRNDSIGALARPLLLPRSPASACERIHACGMRSSCGRRSQLLLGRCCWGLAAGADATAAAAAVARGAGLHC